MIGVEVSGALGNQMFQYAFIYSLSKRLRTPFFLVKSGAPLELYKYFYLQNNTFLLLDKVFFNIPGFKLFFSHYLRTAFYNLLKKTGINRQIVIDNFDDPSTVIGNLKDHTLYKGFFQSPLYSAGNTENLLNIFKVKNKYIKAYNGKFGWLKKEQTVVVIHIRKTDYTHAFSHLDLGGSDLSLPFNYYHTVLKEIDKESNYYVFISDDILSVKEEFSYLKNVWWSEENAITDFQLMLNADICITANSSFSWWAAYLNTKPNKMVYCPENYLGFLKKFDYPVKIYPENWITVPAI